MGVTNPLAGHPDQVAVTSVVIKFPIFMVSTDMSPYSLMSFNLIHKFTPYFSKTQVFSHLRVSFANVFYCFSLLMKILCASLISPRNSK